MQVVIEARNPMMSESKVRLKKITHIKPQKNNQDRVSIWLDNSFWKGLDYDVVVGLDLKVGDLVDGDDLEKIVRKEDFSKAANRALKLLEYRERSEYEISDRLKRSGFTKEVISVVIDRLKSKDFLDDKRFAENWIKSRLSKNYGAYRIKSELIKKRIDREIIDKSIKKLIDPKEETDKVTYLAEKRLSQLKEDKIEKAYQKTMRYLTGRGFDYSIVSEVLNELLFNKEEED